MVWTGGEMEVIEVEVAAGTHDLYMLAFVSSFDVEVIGSSAVTETVTRNWNVLQMILGIGEGSYGAGRTL